MSIQIKATFIQINDTFIQIEEILLKRKDQYSEKYSRIFYPTRKILLFKIMSPLFIAKKNENLK